MDTYIRESATRYNEQYNLFDASFTEKYKELYNTLSTYGAMSSCKFATRRLLGLSYTDGPLPYIDQTSIMDMVSATRNMQLYKYFHELVSNKKGIFGSDLADLCTYINSNNILHISNSHFNSDIDGM